MRGGGVSILSGMENENRSVWTRFALASDFAVANEEEKLIGYELLRDEILRADKAEKELRETRAALEAGNARGRRVIVALKRASVEGKRACESSKRCREAEQAVYAIIHECLDEWDSSTVEAAR